MNLNAVHAVLFSLFGFSSQAEWNYEENEHEAQESQWPGQCTVGSKQSPINIMTRDALIDKHGAHIRGPLVFRGYKEVSVSAINNGHTLQWNAVPGAPAPTVSGGPLRGNYSFMQFHLHWLSEHALDGMKYPLEIHMVHIKTGLTREEAVLRPDGLAVIGVICQVRSEDESEHALKQIMPVVPDLVNKTETGTPAETIDISRLFSPYPQSFYTYHGSLTTPMCQEAVTWIVMDNPLPISDVQYKLFSKVNVGGVDNYRSLQRINDRIVYRTVASCSSVAVPGFLGFLVGLINCSTTTMAAVFGQGVCIVTNMKRKVFGNSLQECS